eukprot:s998_g9.t1
MYIVRKGTSPCFADRQVVAFGWGAPSLVIPPALGGDQDGCQPLLTARQRLGRAFSSCTACTTIDAADWIFCLDSHGQVETKRLRKAKDKFAKETLELDPSRLETLTMDLFKAHDLNGDGFLQDNGAKESAELAEMELITLNERIAMLHHGKGAFELQEVRDTYSRLFRTKLDPQGRPIPFEIFRRYARGVLEELDQDPEAQD